MLILTLHLIVLQNRTTDNTIAKIKGTNNDLQITILKKTGTLNNMNPTKNFRLTRVICPLKNEHQNFEIILVKYNYNTDSIQFTLRSFFTNKISSIVKI